MAVVFYCNDGSMRLNLSNTGALFNFPTREVMTEVSGFNKKWPL